MMDFSCLPNQLYEQHACVDLNGPNYGPGPEEEAFHELPDGSIIHVPYNVCASSGEVLFSPSSMGHDKEQPSITNIALQAFEACDNDLKNQFKSCITVAGGTVSHHLLPRLHKFHNVTCRLSTH